MVTAVLFDFYGTLAEATQWVSIDGIEHLEHSQSREHYVAWQRERILGMLAETDVHPGEYEVILEKLREGTETRVLEPYPEVHGVLDALRRRGVPLAVCSNWDWDLLHALEDVGVLGRVDVVVSSAWAGARKPHPRIFQEALQKL